MWLNFVSELESGKDDTVHLSGISSLAVVLFNDTIIISISVFLKKWCNVCILLLLSMFSRKTVPVLKSSDPVFPDKIQKRKSERFSHVKRFQKNTQRYQDIKGNSDREEI